ncbi:MAG: hypothetical protein ABRQ37_27315, partial [Candidatus Eremiobacterota bacterium]
EELIDKDGKKYTEARVTVSAVDEDGNEIKGETAAISDINLSKTGFKFKTHDKKGSLELLARLYGLLKDEFKFSGKVEVKPPLDLSKLSNEELTTFGELIRKTRNI